MLAIIASMTIEELKVAGCMLYAGEGTKARRDRRSENRYIYAIELTNSAPTIIALFARFLKEVMFVDQSRLRGQLFVYPDHNQQELITYWSNVSGIPISQFQKVILLEQKNSKYKPNPLGTFKVRYSHKVDFLRLQEMIEGVWRGAGIVISEYQKEISISEKISGEVA